MNDYYHKMIKAFTYVLWDLEIDATMRRWDQRALDECISRNDPNR